MKKLICVWLAILLAFWPTTAVWAQSGGNCSIFRSWITGDSLTAGDLTSSFTTVGVTNMTQACIDGISDTVAGMQTTTDPYASETESLATSGAGELQRLRFVLGRVFGFSQWYKHTENVNFGGIGQTKTNIQGSGLGQHMTAVGLHTWSGSQRFPIFTSTNSHTTGLFWPAAHHLAISVDPAVDRDGAGVETYRFHAQAFTLHHTAAIRFRHSAAFNSQWQYPHITALSITGPQRGPDGRIPGQREPNDVDRLIVGHAATVLNLVGYGASHIALGNRSYIALGSHVSLGIPVANALYGDMIPKAFLRFITDPPEDRFNVAGVSNPDTGLYIVTWERAFASTQYVVVATVESGNAALMATVESQAATHAVIRTWSALGAPGTAANAGFRLIAIGRQ